MHTAEKKATFLRLFSPRFFVAFFGCVLTHCPRVILGVFHDVLAFLRSRIPKQTLQRVETATERENGKTAEREEPDPVRWGVR